MVNLEIFPSHTHHIAKRFFWEPCSAHTRRLAQLVEHLPYTQNVDGSTPSSSNDRAEYLFPYLNLENLNQNIQDLCYWFESNSRLHLCRESSMVEQNHLKVLVIYSPKKFRES